MAAAVEDGEGACSVCFEVLDAKDISILPCGHMFHAACMLEWTCGQVDAEDVDDVHACCPMCRKRLRRIPHTDSELETQLDMGRSTGHEAFHWRASVDLVKFNLPEAKGRGVDSYTSYWGIVPGEPGVASTTLGQLQFLISAAQGSRENSLSVQHLGIQCLDFYEPLRGGEDQENYYNDYSCMKYLDAKTDWSRVDHQKYAFEKMIR